MLQEMGRTNKASTAKANPGRLLISGPNHSLIHLRGGVWRMSTRFSPVRSFLSCLLKKIGTCRRGQLGCNNVMELHTVVQYNPQWCFMNAPNNARHNLNRQFESPREIKTFLKASKVTHWQFPPYSVISKLYFRMKGWNIVCIYINLNAFLILPFGLGKNSFKLYLKKIKINPISKTTLFDLNYNTIQKFCSGN